MQMGMSVKLRLKRKLWNKDLGMRSFITDNNSLANLNAFASQIYSGELPQKSINK